MRITFLGTGTSQGIPLIGCTCVVCRSTDKKDNRLRSSILVQYDNVHIVVDTGPDFRYQMLRAEVTQLDAVLFTHGHKDHLAGLDDVRAYNFILKRALDVYATEATQTNIKQEFSYIFNSPNYPGIPKINLHTIDGQTPIDIKEHLIIPIEVMHYKMPVLGFRFDDFTYITDANFISEEAMEKIKGSKVLVLNALRHEEHISHFNLKQAIELAHQSGVPEIYFTHISHQLGLHNEVEQNFLPPHFHLAYDGLTINL